MSHLRPEELLDLAEGTRSGELPLHLASCDACRRELSDLRATLATVAEVEVPEPSPLFWDHLSARVRQAVEAEDRTGTLWRRPVPRIAWRFLVPLGAAAALVGALAVGLWMGVSEPGAGVGPAAESGALLEATADADVAAGMTDDASIGLMADLAGEWDWEFAAE